jgi:hypothetical protein
LSSNLFAFLRQTRFVAVFAALAVLVLPASATVFSIQGQFGNTSFSGPLNGGSFSGTYTVSGLPIADGSQVLLNSWDVTLFSAANTALAHFTIANGCAGCNNVDGRFSPASGNVLNFGDTAGDFLELQFLAPFNGIGSVVPFVSAIGSFSSFAGIGGNTAQLDSIVTAGSSTLAVPEPSSISLLALASFVCLAGLTARRLSFQDR